MIKKHEFPICEFDPKRDTMVDSAVLFKKTLPEICVLTFFKKELTAFAKEHDLPVIDGMHSEIVDIPVYGYNENICISQPFSHAPGAAGTIEKLRGMGCKKFVVCGGAGMLTPGSKPGEVLIPTSAIRDEGVSYHYIPASREIECDRGSVELAKNVLTELGVPFTEVKTWTTDAIFRETPDMIAARRDEGCVTVEMEAAAFFAVTRYHSLPFVQLLYSGDDVSGKKWDPRDWSANMTARERLIRCSLEIAKRM